MTRLRASRKTDASFARDTALYAAPARAARESVKNACPWAERSVDADQVVACAHARTCNASPGGDKGAATADGPRAQSGKHKIRAILQASRKTGAAAGSLAWAWMDAHWQLHGVHATLRGWIQASSHRIAMGANSTESSSGGERHFAEFAQPRSIAHSY
ncbi:hypothetical protein L1887_51401 [Cichorium endivia]|nr:hypothetical protein L1887_51401 [Cichorium endivia]